MKEFLSSFIFIAEENEERSMIEPRSFEDPKLKELIAVLIEWINDELADQRIIVKDIEEDLYDGQVLQKLLGFFGNTGNINSTIFNITEKLTGEKLDVPEVTQSEEGQKQKLGIVLAATNRKLDIPAGTSVLAHHLSQEEDEASLSDSSSNTSITGATEMSAKATETQDDETIELEEETFLVANYEYKKGNNTCIRQFVGVATKIGAKDVDVMFLRQYNNSKQIFVFPPVADEDTIPKDKIAALLRPPKVEKGKFTFDKEVLTLPRWSQQKWSVESVHSKNIVAILHLLVALARHFRAPVRLPENVAVGVVVVQKRDGSLSHRTVLEEITSTYDDLGMRCERDAFDTLFDHAPDKLQVVKKSLVTFVNKHLNKVNLEVSDLDTQFHDGVYLTLLMGLLEGFFVPLYSFHLTPQDFDQKVHNVSFAFELMQDVGLAKPKARPEDIVNLDLKSTLRVLYNLFTKYKNMS
ncbi:hypothetical protein C0J52_16875 [Blattella germanica]|nr:hypothetical protein C0J52_16875 [Blattella germanica]